MIRARATDGVKQNRGISKEGLTAFHLAVKDSQRVGQAAPLTVRTELRSILLEEPRQHLTVAFSAFLTTQRIDMEDYSRQPKTLQEKPEHMHDLGIQHWIINTEGLGIDLVKLTISSFLRTFMAKHGADDSKIFGPAGPPANCAE